LLIGGRRLRRNYRNILGKASTPSASLGHGLFGNIEMLVCLMGVAPNLQQAVQAFKDEASAWQFAGAKGLATLYLELGVVQG